MSTNILKSITEDNESEYQEDIFDLPPLNNKYSNKIDYILYDKSFDHKMTKYEDDNLCMFSDSYSFYEPMPSPDIHNLSSPFYEPMPSPLDLIYNKLDSDSYTEICSQEKKKPRGRKRRSIPKIDKIYNINISQPIIKSSSSFTIGIYTKAERLEKIRKYKEKKRNPVKNRVLYQCRKKFADKRERVSGRFVKVKINN